MPSLAMFPLGSVLFPYMPLPLRVFEPRYMAMLAEVLADEPSEFGVVLIERGQEVGGGDSRFGVGTRARITELQEGDGFIVVIARGASRIEVEEWQSDDPFPRASVRDLPELEWDESLQPKLIEAEEEVRGALIAASEFVELPWSADIELSDDPLERVWQLAGIAPLGPVDQVRLLRATSIEDLLDDLILETDAALASLRFAWTAERDEEFGGDFNDDNPDD